MLKQVALLSQKRRRDA